MAKAIMIQGTMSNSGKSFITAGLCRIFRQDGYSCVPFKSQNMALNSYITADGSEMGRAQAMQAESAKIEPSALMNPILLKPTTDTGSQVIVNGKPVGNMTAREYFRRKKDFLPDILRAYNELSEKHDIIVIEGAGSPVELNLKKDDIVNMGMAEMVKSPVVLVGDIDRGGIFAQLVGTLSLLESHELDMVKGLIVNKFRGDRTLFNSGVDILRQRANKQVLGVVPYIHCDIEDEDSLAERLENRSRGLVNIAVVKLPKMSNFTDFDVFSQYDGVGVQYVTKYTDLENADFIIIPGTKSTISDMKWLRESGMEAMIKKCADRGVAVFGICGGYQILGENISDPSGAENGGDIDGMGLLDCRTVFSNEKKQSQVCGKFLETEGFFECLKGAEFDGYEIHMGRTENNGKKLTSVGGSYRGNVYGCYVHGIFDGEVSERIVKRLFAEKGMTYSGNVTDRRKYKEKQFDILADGIRNSINMDMLYRIIENGVK
ncbi:MAG: cobyric acid synthase [Ruminococcus flavefaciens]|nr:cobyric acid synthase [Ruminococcus flavefaciens]